MISRDIEFDKQNIISILQTLGGAERAKYLKAHRNEIAKNLAFIDEKELGEFILNLVYFADATTSSRLTGKDIRKCNSLIAAEMIKLLQPHLTHLMFATCYNLLARLSTPSHIVDDHFYPFRLSLAQAMHSAIHHPQEMGQVAKLLHEKDAAIFIKAQHKYWEKHKKKNTPVKNNSHPAGLFAPAPEPSAPPAEYFEPPKQKG